MIKIVYKKIKNNNGSAMILAIVVLFIATMAIGLFTFQVNNQIKFTKRTEDSMISRYEIEGGIEVVLAKLIDTIEVKVDTKRVPIGNSGKYDTVKTIVVNYSSSLDESILRYLKDRGYDIEVNSELRKSEIELEGSISNETYSNNKATIVLERNINSLEKIKLPYYANISHKLNNTKAKEYKIDIEITDIVESNSYGIGYKIEEVK